MTINALGIVSTLLKAASAVTALTTDERIYFYKAPQGGDTPYIVLNRIGKKDEQMLSGAGGYYEDRIRVECLGTDPATVEAIGEAVLAALEDVVKQTVSDATDVDVRFADVDRTDPADAVSLDRRLMDFYVRWR